MKQWCEAALQRGIAYLPPSWQNTAKANLFGWLHVPMIAYCTPQVQQLQAEACSLTITLGFRTRNHVGSMYFGALAVGADMAAGLLCQWHIEAQQQPMVLLFKSLSAQFVRRADTDVRFTCSDGAALAQLVEQARGGERVECEVGVVAANHHYPEQVFAQFRLVVSLKLRQ